MNEEIEVNGVLFSTDKSRLNILYIHHFLFHESYWAKGIPLNLVERSIHNSMCFGVYDKRKQIGFARVISDFATFGYLADVFIDEAYRGKGFSKTLMEFILSRDELKILRRFILATADAHGLYRQYGFRPLKVPERFMEIHQPDIYKS
jgi:GNAT superfamily N-acetyltransferase